MDNQQKSKFSLMEEPLLWCLRKDGDFSSGPIASKMANVSIVSAIMMELALRDRIDLFRSNNTVEFKLRGSEPTDDDILNSAIEIMKNEKQVDMDSWIKKLNGTLIFNEGIKDLKQRVMNKIIQKGTLSIEVFVKTSYPWKNEQEINEVAENIKRLINLSTDKIDTLSERDLCLIGLFYALDKPFEYRVGNALDINRIYPDKEERSKMRKNLDALIQSQKLNESGEVANEVKKSVIRRMIRIMIFGMFTILFNL